MSTEPICPKCQCENTYQDMEMWVCPECFYEWDPSKSVAIDEESTSAEFVVKDSNGAVLVSGDSVTIIKSLKVKGSPNDIKVGTKVKNIRIIQGEDNHHIACKIDGFGSMFLKGEVVKKA